ncbi:MAG: hypothetical protein ACRDSZ_16800 [Pseudonocardiaceae bacterium]
MTLTTAQQEQIVRRLRELGATLPCPRCAAASFSLVKELSVVPVDPEASAVRVDRLTLPAVLLMCNQCGFLSSHALAALGLVEEIFGHAAADGG